MSIEHTGFPHASIRITPQKEIEHRKKLMSDPSWLMQQTGMVNYAKKTQQLKNSMGVPSGLTGKRPELVVLDDLIAATDLSSGADASATVWGQRVSLPDGNSQILIEDVSYDDAYYHPTWR